MICLKVILILNNLLDEGKANMETWMSQTCKKIVTEIKLKIIFNINYDTTIILLGVKHRPLICLL